MVGVTTWATIESRRPSVVTESDQSVREESPQDAAIELGGPNAAPDDMEERTAIADQLCNRLMAHKVQQIGRVVVLYRPEADA